jgi:hypothetical protein
MRFAYVAALFLVATGTGVFLACSSSDATTNNASSSGGSSSGKSSSGSSGASSGGNVVDSGGFWYSPDGCVIHCTDHKEAGKAASAARSDKPGAIAWSSPDQAIKADTTGITDSAHMASVTLNDGDESEYLEVSNFDFSEVTDDKETWGISVELTRHSIDAGVADSTIEVTFVGGLVDGGVPNSKVLDGVWPREIVGVHHYGQAIDTWGVDLNPIDVRPTAFGARVAAKRVPGVTGPVTAQIDALKVAVCYCNADRK